MNDFKQRWEISKNWQLIFPFFGILALFYSGIKISSLFDNQNLWITIILGIVIAIILLKICLWCINALENKWQVDQRWELIRIFIVFALTGSSSVFVSRPLIDWMGITKENLNILLYYILFIFVSLVCYQILLIFYGWLLGQFSFFWEFEKKILKRLGLKID